MSASRGNLPATDKARPANKRTDTPEPDPALMRKAITALCELAASEGHPLRRSAARQRILVEIGRGRSVTDTLRGAKNEHGKVDETGATAARNLDRIKWAESARKREAARG